MRKYRQSIDMSSTTRFSKTPMAEVEFSRMRANPTWSLPFNAGDIVPVYYAEVLPHDTFSVDLDFVIRQNTVLRPTMGNMQVDFFAYFVPNRIVNESWKNIQGENTSGFWTAPEVNLAPLFVPSVDETQVYIPVGSVADYYGFPTQNSIRGEVLSQCNDLKFKGYLEIYNNYFRDENYQPPIPYSKLNIYQGFLNQNGYGYNIAGETTDDGYSLTLAAKGGPPPATDGSFPEGAITKAIFGPYGMTFSLDTDDELHIPSLPSSWKATNSPLKANKLHDVFTSALPSPQKGADVYFSVGGTAPVIAGTDVTPFGSSLRLTTDGEDSENDTGAAFILGMKNGDEYPLALSSPETVVNGNNVTGWNAVADLSKATGIPINELRTAIATQQVYETLARGGSRYVEMLRSFFEIETESPFMDIPLELGHIRRDLDLYQVAQTSSSDSNSPQGTLTAYGYTTKGGHLFTRTFLEHGYIHIFAVVRQRNVYSTYFAPDNFRRSTLDFYLPQFANIGEQPIRLATLNPFAEDSMEKVLGYQEAWWEYRYEPDRVHGLFRSGVSNSLDVWTYVDKYDPYFEVIDGDWMKSNAEEVLNRTLAVTSDVAPQFKGQFMWKIDKQRPMPTYSVPGLDSI